MKKTIKRITALALTVTLGIFSLTACGKKEKKAETADIVIGTANGSLCLAPLHVEPYRPHAAYRLDNARPRTA